MELEGTSIAAKTEDRLKYFIDDIGKGYDYIFIDCPPTVSIFTLSGFIACDAYLIPVKPDYLSQIGLILLGELINRYEGMLRHKKIEIGTIISIYQDYPIPRKLLKTLKTNLEQRGKFIFDEKVSMGTNASHSVASRKLLFEYHKGNCSQIQGKEVRNITIELLGRLKEIEKK